MSSMLLTTHEARIVVGVDVGGMNKGFHAVLLKNGDFAGLSSSTNAVEVATWIEEHDAVAVGVDAPCRWSALGRSRTAERALALDGIHAFSTPTKEAAEGRQFYGWMLNGMKMYAALGRFRLFDGSRGRLSLICFETFPHAVACALAGRVVSAKQKATIRPC